MDFKIYKQLVRIRVLMDTDPVKAKQLLTNLIKEMEAGD